MSARSTGTRTRFLLAVGALVTASALVLGGCGGDSSAPTAKGACKEVLDALELANAHGTKARNYQIRLLAAVDDATRAKDTKVRTAARAAQKTLGDSVEHHGVGDQSGDQGSLDYLGPLVALKQACEASRG